MRVPETCKLHKAFLLVEKLKMIIGDFCLKETAHSVVAF